MQNEEEIVRRHAQVYETSGLPPLNYDAVDERIFAGRNPLTERDVTLLAEQGVTHFLDLREPHEWAPPRFGATALQEIERRGLVRRNTVVEDMGAPTAEAFDEACNFLDEVLAQPQGRVYVHYRAGMERTAAILLAYHARQHGLTYDEALTQLRQKRAILNPLPGQECATRRYLATLTNG